MKGIQKKISLNSILLGNEEPFTLFGGVNVIESSDLTFNTAKVFKDVTHELSIPFIFKASFDKANRSSIQSFRGLGLKNGISVLEKIKAELNLPLITDIHEPFQAKIAAEVCDVLQIPAFLARQTDLVVAAAETKKIINIKKPQFLSPPEMRNVIHKCLEAGNDQVILCERGSTFGYNRLIVDMIGLQVMKRTGYPVLFDVTHSLQLPGALKDRAGGQSEHLLSLAKSGMASKIAGLFLEAHPKPSKAKCDGECALKLDLLYPFLKQIKDLDELIKKQPSLDIRS